MCHYEFLPVGKIIKWKPCPCLLAWNPKELLFHLDAQECQCHHWWIPPKPCPYILKYFFPNLLVSCYDDWVLSSNVPLKKNIWVKQRPTCKTSYVLHIHIYENLCDTLKTCALYVMGKKIIIVSLVLNRNSKNGDISKWLYYKLLR